MTPLEEFERDLVLITSIEGLGEITDAMNHDVGKYIARVARNVSAYETGREALTPTLLAMLVKDLFETHQSKPASARFATLRAELPESLRASRIIEDVAARLRAIDSLESKVRIGDAGAVGDAVRESLLISGCLSGVARAVRRVMDARGDDA